MTEAPSHSGDKSRQKWEQEKECYFVSESIREVMEYIQYSEMEGEVDPQDSWFSTYELLKELREKVLDEEDIIAQNF